MPGVTFQRPTFRFHVGIGENIYKIIVLADGETY